MRTHLFVLLMLAGLSFGSGGLSAKVYGQSLQYDWQTGQKFSYRFDISVESVGSTTSYKGMTHYTVGAVGPDQLKVNYKGGLQESTKRKSSSGRSRGFGGFGPMPPRIPSPFSRPTFAGKTQTTNKITISPQGSVIAMEGSSQLPYLLGNVSLIPFEPLPASERQEWVSDSGVAITEKSDSSRNRFGPFSPFGNDDKESVQSASEVIRYRVREKSNNQIKITRTYAMKMPKSSDDASFDMTGTGTWVYDTTEHIPHSLDMDYKLIITKGGTTTTVPISVKYTRVSPEELANIAAEAKRKADEKAQAAALAKAAAEAPLTADEKNMALSALVSGDTKGVVAKLGELAKKKLADPDPEVAAVIESLLASEDKGIAKAASSALMNWSASYRLKKSLAKAYQGPGVIKSTGRVVESITPLYVGQLVQAQQPRYGSFWRAAKVEELMPDGKVKLGFLTWGKVRSSSAVDRRNIQLAPDELDQPAKPKSVSIAAKSNALPSAASKPAGEARTWSDATGRFKVEAVFVSLKDGTVSIRRMSDNRVIPIPIAKLSQADQTYLQQLEAAENPFAIP
ncbi:SLA1 homology domain 1, SHD1 [Neorhodopirellula lusitana]|uniref:SLA1 homology domain 1, SHD1 n=1 Tax=Neorhodopirellula lusitana TaxID=445327 RepID=A0ABY1QH13_9BACT|nr:SHD1 domain-containing protein [Neorhodopirellula lusitana]SMP69104.1 SLA1 homology domain 1, SHD1 [Neorhodopirellula lusitana]